MGPARAPETMWEPFDMRHAFRNLTVALVTLGLASQSLVAGELSIESADYAKLPEEQQKRLVEELQGKGLLAGDDTIVYTGPEVSERRAPPAVLLTLAPLACRAVLAAKRREDLAQCGVKPPEEQEQCTADVEGRLGTIDLVCNAIRLF